MTPADRAQLLSRAAEPLHRAVKEEAENADRAATALLQEEAADTVHIADVSAQQSG